jgi:sulfate permease, SulP family
VIAGANIGCDTARTRGGCLKRVNFRWCQATVAVGLASLLLIKFWPKRWAGFVRGLIVAVIAGTWIVRGLDLPVVTIASRFGEGAFPSGLPELKPLSFDLQPLGSLIRPAMAITLLGGIESLLSAVVADGMTDDWHDSNQELMGQGVANFVVPFFGGIPVTGVLARTATNVRNGANSPIAGMTHALTLLLIVLVASPVAKFIPLTGERGTLPSHPC